MKSINMVSPLPKREANQIHMTKKVILKQEVEIMALTLGASSAMSFKNSLYLKDAKSRMDKSLLRISSGRRILSAADDPGGLALSMRLSNELTINNTIQNNVENSSPSWKCRIPH